MNNPIIDAAKRFFSALLAMQILRIFGIVVAVHGVAFMMIMASPGCSTKPRHNKDVASSAPASAPAAASEQAQSNPFVAAPSAGGSSSSPSISFDPNAVAGGPRLSPVRPNTAESSSIVHEATTPPAPAPVAQKTIKVGKGDSLWTVAKKYGVPVSELAEANKLKTGATLHVGQTLVVPVKGAPASATKSEARSTDTAKSPTPTSAPAAEAAHKAASAANLPAGSIRHTVKPGESLGSIAKKYGVKAGDIGVANNITDPKTLRPGRDLIIPGAAKLSKSAASSETGAAKSDTGAAAAPTGNTAAEAAQAPAAAPVFQFGDSSSSGASAGEAGKSSPSAPVPVIKIEEDNSSK